MSGRNLSQLEMAEETDWVWAEKDALNVGTSSADKDLSTVDGVKDVSADFAAIAIKA